MAHGRYKAKIVKPAEILTQLFDAINVTVVNEEESDEGLEDIGPGVELFKLTNDFFIKV